MRKNADTIAAIATAHGRAGIGVIRISGPGTEALATALTGQLPPERRAQLSSFVDANGIVIDRGIALYFQGPRSYTGEDVLEIQVHGGIAILRMLLRRCVELGARVAEPGEFTKRAFLNDKLDLLQAEAVADLIDASSADAVRSAQRSLSGEFSAGVGTVREELVAIRVLVEAVLDFPEEQVDLIAEQGLLGKLSRCAASVNALMASAKQGNLLRDGVQVVLMGAPNVGKSSLMNRLAEEEVAIVTEVPGTTRDVLRRELVVGGVPLHVIDTAGLRETNDPVERIGVERTLKEISRADIVLHIRSAVDADGDNASARFSPSVNTRKINIINKIDLAAQTPRMIEEGGVLTIWLSAKNGDGVELLRDALLDASGRKLTDEVPYMARERHLGALSAASAHLEAALKHTDELELCAEELRLAQRALGEVTGEFTADDLLGEIFSRFCIGK